MLPLSPTSCPENKCCETPACNASATVDACGIHWAVGLVDRPYKIRIVQWVLRQDPNSGFYFRDEATREVVAEYEPTDTYREDVYQPTLSATFYSYDLEMCCTDPGPYGECTWVRFAQGETRGIILCSTCLALNQGPVIIPQQFPPLDGRSCSQLTYRITASARRPAGTRCGLRRVVVDGQELPLGSFNGATEDGPLSGQWDVAITAPRVNGSVSFWIETTCGEFHRCAFEVPCQMATTQIAIGVPSYSFSYNDAVQQPAPPDTNRSYSRVINWDYSESVTSPGGTVVDDYCSTGSGTRARTINHASCNGGSYNDGRIAQGFADLGTVTATCECHYSAEGANLFGTGFNQIGERWTLVENASIVFTGNAILCSVVWPHVAGQQGYVVSMRGNYVATVTGQRVSTNVATGVVTTTPNNRSYNRPVTWTLMRSDGFSFDCPVSREVPWRLRLSPLSGGFSSTCMGYSLPFCIWQLQTTMGLLGFAWNAFPVLSPYLTMPGYPAQQGIPGRPQSCTPTTVGIVNPVLANMPVTYA